jgi:hypothetical protein
MRELIEKVHAATREPLMSILTLEYRNRWLDHIRKCCFERSDQTVRQGCHHCVVAVVRFQGMLRCLAEMAAAGSCLAESTFAEATFRQTVHSFLQETSQPKSRIGKGTNR